MLPRRPSHRRTTRSPESRRRSKARTTAPSEPPPRFHFLGGKGGVGKTTCAAAMAVAFARAGARTLVISTDPAPSLGDALSRPLSSRPRRIDLARGELYAAEIDARQVLRRWLLGRQATLQQIVLRGTWLDEDDVSRFLQMSLPGIDEFAALLEIARVGSGTRYDRIVVDTAPTGHTLRLLGLPEVLRAIAAVFDRMQSKHRAMVEAIRGGWIPDRADQLVAEIDREGSRLSELLRDPASTRMTWVTLPEAMAVEETADAVAALSDDGIPIHEIIVNRLTPTPRQACERCRRRRAGEASAVARLRSRIPRIRVIGVPARAHEPRGPSVLARIGAEIAAAAPLSLHRPRAIPGTWHAPGFASGTGSAIDAIVGAASRILLFGGKGGVGKTTCAAAAALALASDHPERPVLLLSSDPAHSLADVLNTSRGQPSNSRHMPHNLRIREIDAAHDFQRVRTRYAASIDALFDRIGNRSGTTGVDASYDREVMHGLIDLAPPGIDEVAAIVDVVNLVDSDPQLLIVMDTAPTGHALRLLEMPGLVQDWTRAIMSMLLKYQSVVPIEEFGPALLSLSQGLGRLRTLLADKDRTSFVVVTRAAVLPREETRRLLRRLRRLRIYVPAAIVNAVGRGSCGRCRGEASAERQQMTQLARELPAGVSLLTAPAELPPPQGPARLIAWHRRWRKR